MAQPDGRMTVEGSVAVIRSTAFGGRGRPPTQLLRVEVWVPDDSAPAGAGGDRGWIVDNALPSWPEAAAHEGHRVRVSAFFGRTRVGARALRARVECADEDEHLLHVLRG